MSDRCEIRRVHRPILTAAEMRACDEATMTTGGIPSRELMERAARAVASCLIRRKDHFPDGQVAVLCGSGNNGGDGFAAARFLSDGTVGERRAVVVLYTGHCVTAEDGATLVPDTGAMSAECARQYRLAREAGVPMVMIQSEEATGACLAGATCLVDALFGIGLCRPVTGREAAVLRAIADRRLPVLAVDIPSGVHADTGAIMGIALPARMTVTMQALKAGLLLHPGVALCGEIAVADIGIALTAACPYARLADASLLSEVLLPRSRRSHKGTYGRVMLLCGSVGMSGAAVLAARAALRSGIGLCEVVTPAENRPILQASVPEAIVTAYSADVPALGAADSQAGVVRAEVRRLVRGAARRVSAVAAGCGLGTGESARVALRALLSALPANGSVPLLLDADALNLLSEDETLWETPVLSSPEAQVVITPHPAEMARLCGKTPVEVLADLPGTALAFARERGVSVVLKDAHTVVASPEGELFICTAGNAGMATGGSGDALAGVIAALLAQTRERPSETLTVTAVAAAGVYLHAAAGDLAARDLGEIGMLPSDLIDRLPLVTRELSDSRTRLDFM